MNIWNLLESKLQQENNLIIQSSEETRVILVGDSKNLVCNKLSSKSLIQSNTSEPCCVAGISYRYINVSTVEGTKILELWQVGGGLNNKPLLDPVLATRTLLQTHAIICVELNDPKLLEKVTFWVHALNKEVRKFAHEANDKRLSKALKARRTVSIEGLSDRKELEPVWIPVLLVATGFKTFSKEQPVAQIKATARALRAVCHKNHMSLIYFSNSGMKAMKSFCLKGFEFVTRKISVNDTDEILVGHGKDSFEQIGRPTGQSRSQNPLLAWKNVLEEYVSTETDEKKTKKKSKQLPDEEIVDRLVAERNAELEKMLREKKLIN